MTRSNVLKNGFKAAILMAQFLTMPQVHGHRQGVDDSSDGLSSTIQESLNFGFNISDADKQSLIPIDDLNLEDNPYKVIYGEDNRKDREDYPDRMFREKAKSVAGMVSKNKIVADFFNPELINFFKKTATREFGLCEDERFSDQITLPVCSGFLVDEQHIVTAGHCFRQESDCENFAWVFDYVKGTSKLKKDNVYNCAEIVDRRLETTYFTVKDYMVIKLDRPVTDREPLEFRKQGRPNYGEDLVVIGHPLGLPQKISDGGEVKLGNIKGALKPISSLIKKRDYFMANLDTFIGNSGSPVFNKETGLVEGILIEGAEDFYDDVENLCSRVERKSDSFAVTDEKIFRTNRIPYLQLLSK